MLLLLPFSSFALLTKVESPYEIDDKNIWKMINDEKFLIAHIKIQAIDTTFEIKIWPSQL